MPATLSQSWTDLVRAAPGAAALIDAAGARAWTRAELHARALAWQAAHRDHALAGRRVAFALPNGVDWLAVFLGLQFSRAIPVPLDPTEPAAERHALARTALAAFAWIDGHLEPIADQPAGRFGPRACLVKLTSGSTGRPRALAFSHAHMFADGRQICTTMGISPSDVNLAVIPFGHSYGLGNLVVPLLAQGTAIVCASSPLPHVLAADIARWHPSVFPAVPPLLRALADSDVPPGGLASLRTIISAGSPLAPEDARRFFEKFARRVHNFYGSTETGGIAYDRGGDATLSGRGVGAPLAGVTLASAARGGRIRVSSPAVGGRGTFSPADRAEFNEHGELRLLGRAGRIAKIAGRRLDLGALERRLRETPGVSDAFVAVHPQNPGELGAVVASALASAALRADLRTRLAPWKIPRRLVVVPAFPSTVRGKPDNRALLALLAR